MEKVLDFLPVDLSVPLSYRGILLKDIRNLTRFQDWAFISVFSYSVLAPFVYKSLEHAIRTELVYLS
jgi:hypothetical protein